jgi:nucleoid DNA-binding protein
MKKLQVARRLATQSRISAGEAADRVDRVLNKLSRRVRKGRSASLPGLGTFRSGVDQDFQFDADRLAVDSPAKPKKEPR